MPDYCCLQASALVKYCCDWLYFSRVAARAAETIGTRIHRRRKEIGLTRRPPWRRPRGLTRDTSRRLSKAKPERATAPPRAPNPTSRLYPRYYPIIKSEITGRRRRARQGDHKVRVTTISPFPRRRLLCPHSRNSPPNADHMLWALVHLHRGGEVQLQSGMQPAGQQTVHDCCPLVQLQDPPGHVSSATVPVVA